MSESTKNVFVKGLDGDTSPALFDPAAMLSGYNVTLTADSNFQTLSNLQGNDEIKQILSKASLALIKDTQLLGVFAVEWRKRTYSGGFYSGVGTLTPSLVIFTGDPDSNFTITLYDINGDLKHTLYTEPFTAAMEAANISIDAIISREGGINTLYFTDNYSVVRKLTCQYSTPIQTLAAAELELLKDTSYGLVTVDSVATTGGSLFCGSYQAAYRCINNETNTYSNFSLLSIPAFVFKEPSDTGDITPSYGDVGIATTSKITFNVTLSDSELIDYTHYQVVLVEDIDGLNSFTSGKLQDPVSINGGANLQAYDYTKNTSIGDVTIDEITVDKAQIKTSKTLLVKDNVLMLGNLTYEPLDYDNGEPIIANTTDSIIATYTGAQVNNNRGFYTQQSDALKVGHFRDEVYRYYISYFNERGMYARPKVLDFSSVTTNNATLGIDFKFPDRSNNAYTILKANGAETEVQALGLQLQGIDNHPTWAKGFVILRAKRKKNIQFQSPLIPTALITPSAAVYNYPTNPNAYTPDAVLDAQPPTNQSGTYIPKNFFRPVTRNIIKRALTGSVTDDDVQWEPDRITTVSPVGLGIGTMVVNGAGGTLTVATGNLSSLKEGDLVEISGFSNSENNGSFIITSDASSSTAFVARADGGQVIAETSSGNITIVGGNGNEVVGNDHVHCVFNPGQMYTDINGLQVSEYTFTGADRLKTVDIAFLNHVRTRHDYNNYNTPSAEAYRAGDGAGTNVTGTFFASLNSSYYYQANLANVTPSVDNPDVEIVSYDLVDNNNVGVTLPHKRGTMVTSSFGDYAGLEAVGADEGFIPDQLKMSVIVTALPKVDVATKCFADSAGYKTSSVITSEALNFLGITSARSTLDNYLMGSSDADEADYPSKNQPVGAVEIVNIEAGLADDRYGDSEDFHEVQYTGTGYVFSAAELVDVAATTSTPITLDVWGGDCFIGQVNYKITTSGYGVVDEDIVAADATTHWGTSFLGQATKECQRPIPYAGMGETLSLFIESEVNIEVTGKDTEVLAPVSVIAAAEIRSVPAPLSRDLSYARSQYSYFYHPAYSNENNQKVFVPFDSFERVNNDFTNRIAYSDTKVYQSTIGGFDTFRANNFYDLDETYGSLTKLVNSNGNVYSILENGVAYIPVLTSVLETTDTAQLAVRSSEYIGKPKYINTINGTKNLRTVAQSNDGFFFFDEDNKQVLYFQQGKGASISDKGMITTFNNLATINNDRDLTAFYNVNKGTYNIIHTDVVNGVYSGHVFNTKLGLWETSYDFGTNGAVLGGVYVDKIQYHIGIDFTQFDLSVYQDDAGTYNEWFNQLVEPRVTIIINPKVDIAKTFNNLRVHATYPLKEVDLLVIKDVAQLNQIANGINLDILPREDYYRLKIPRDEKGARLRGGLLQGTFKWEETSDKKVTLNSIITKYLPSRRVI